MMTLSSWSYLPTPSGSVGRTAGLVMVVLVLALPAAARAQAEEERWYVGLGLGAAEYSKNESSTLCEEFDLTCKQDEDDFSFKIMGGYQIAPYLAVELGISDFGQVKASEQAASVDVLEFASSSVYLAAIPELPLGEHFSIFGELGVAYVDTEVEVLRAGPLGALVGGGASDEVWAPVYGLGVAGHVARWSFRLLWERIDPDTEFDLGPAKIDAPDLEVLGLTVIYRF